MNAKWRPFRKNKGWKDYRTTKKKKKKVKKILQNEGEFVQERNGFIAWNEEHTEKEIFGEI